MPYIDPSVRRDLEWGERDPETPGELNWVITMEIVAYLDRKGLSYQTINDVLGALEGAKLEFDYRVVRAYEAEKRKINGDVYR